MYTNACKVCDVCQLNAQPFYLYFEVYVIIFDMVLICTTAPVNPEVVSGRGVGVSGEPCALCRKRERRELNSVE